MASSVTVNLGQVPVHAGYNQAPFQPHVLVVMDRAKTSITEEMQPFANPANVSHFVQAYMDTLAIQDHVAYGEFVNDLHTRNIMIFQGSDGETSIYMFSGNPRCFMPNPQDREEHTYKLRNPSALKTNFPQAQFSLISHIGGVLPKAQEAPVADATPKKNWFDHAQTTAFPIPYPKFDSKANNLSKAIRKWSQITYPVFKKADDLSLTINRTIGKYSGGLSLVIRATLVALGIIGYGLSMAAGFVSYIPAKYFFPKLFGDYGVNVGPITLWVNNNPDGSGARVIQEVRNFYDGEKKLTERQINAMREHYRYYLQAIINEILLNPATTEFERMRFLAVFEHGRDPIPTANYGIRFEGEVQPFTVPDRLAFEHKYDIVLKFLDDEIEAAFQEPPIADPVPNWFNHILDEPIPIPRPPDPAAGTNRFFSSSIKVTQAAHSVFKTFDDWAVAFDKTAGKYLGAFSLIGRAVIDLTGLAFGLGVLILGHVTYFPIAGSFGLDKP